MDSRLVDELIDDIFSVLPVFNKKMFNIGDNLLKDKDISRAHIRIIFALKKHGKITVTDLGKSLTAPKSNVTNWVDKLVKADMVERIFVEKDRRLTYLQLTNKGAEFSVRYMEALKYSFGQKLWKFTDEDLVLFKEALENMKKLLAKINDAD